VVTKRRATQKISLTRDSGSLLDSLSSRLATPKTRLVEEAIFDYAVTRGLNARSWWSSIVLWDFDRWVVDMDREFGIRVSVRDYLLFRRFLRVRALVLFVIFLWLVLVVVGSAYLLGLVFYG
jgi:hypothetical protein